MTTTTTTTTRLHIIRHAEAIHNTTHDKTLPDPELSAKGIQQARTLCRDFPYKQDVDLVITSPLRRAIQTTLEGFRDVLDWRYFVTAGAAAAEGGGGGGGGVPDGASLLVDPEVQAHSSRPCDTGSPREVLQSLFPHLSTSFAGLALDWQLKQGPYSADDEAVAKRAERVRRRLVERFSQLRGPRRDIVIVSHGGFITYLTGDPQMKIPAAGWKSFSVMTDDEGKVVLHELCL
ncbi:hypothetical protein VTN77DRAFT_3627 [Rasamsonia byssochlamydoides]|uniref:uncharacterized protein n=1 Tax=Rasamsonia byssochlamydoides TaxID=89139 RepID=UPI003741EF1F